MDNIAIEGGIGQFIQDYAPPNLSSAINPGPKAEKEKAK